MSDRLKSARLTAAAVLALLLFNYPFLAVFDLDTARVGCPGAVGLSVRRVGRRHRARGVDFEVLMLDTWVIVGASVAYLGLLFAIAYYGDRRADRRRSIISNGYIYALSLCVYATSWTYYGSVGRAATTGVGFLPIYLGPTIMAVVWWLVLRKIIRICKRYRITSLADFVSSRYGKSRALGELVTVIAVVGIVPYIALQLKAISNTFTILRGQPDLATGVATNPPVLADTALYVALLLAAFTIVFGTRHLDATERHEGMVAAIAFESLVKLVAFLAVGAYVTFGLFGGFGDLFGRAQDSPELARLLTFGETQSYASWLWLIVLSMFAILLLPRQWQVAVVENVDERHIKTASWLFPLYLLLINIFVMPIAIAGLLTFGDGGAGGDAYVLALPMADQQAALALLVFIGGLSAATGMVIVETIALSTMVSNSLVLPTLLRYGGGLVERRDLGRLILGIRRATIVVVLLLGFAYFRLAGESLALASIGLISFAAVAQFAPAIFGGLYWRGATGVGAIWGLAAGFAVWAYTLPLPSLVGTGFVPASFVEEGPFGFGALAPHALFGLDGLDPVSHSMLWSMLVNVGLFVGLSLTGRRKSAEHVQASTFVDVFTPLGREADPRLWRGTVSVHELRGTAGPVPGPRRGAGRVRVVRRPHGNRRLARCGGGCRPRPPCRDPARRRSRIGVRAIHGGVGRGRGAAGGQRGGADPRRDVPGAGLQSRPRAQVRTARAGDLRASGGQLPPPGARPAQGRLRLHHQPRAANSADVHPGVLGDPAGQPRPGSRRACGLSADRRRRDRATDPLDQPGARPVQARVRKCRVADRARRPGSGAHDVHAGHCADLPRTRGCPRDGSTRACAGRSGRRGPARPGDAQPPLERREVLPAGVGPGAGRRRAARRRRTGRRLRQRTGRRRRGPGRHLREVPSGRRHPDQPSVGHGARAADQPTDRGSPRRPALGGEHPGRGATFSFELPVAAVDSSPVPSERDS